MDTRDDIIAEIEKLRALQKQSADAGYRMRISDRIALLLEEFDEETERAALRRPSSRRAQMGVRELAEKAAEDAGYTRRFIEVGCMLWATGMVLGWAWHAAAWLTANTAALH